MPDKPMMPAPRTREGKRGRPANSIVFPDADVLWARFNEYKDWCLDPDNMIEIGKWQRKVKRPLTIPGFAAFVQCGEMTVRRAADREDLKHAWQAIEAEIHDNLISGGLLKQLDGPLVARIVALVDRQAIVTPDDDAGKKYDWSKLTEDELKTVEALLAKAEIKD